jgi:hypothetical protein
MTKHQSSKQTEDLENLGKRNVINANMIIYETTKLKIKITQ